MDHQPPAPYSVQETTQSEFAALLISMENQGYKLHSWNFNPQVTAFAAGNPSDHGIIAVFTR